MKPWASLGLLSILACVGCSKENNINVNGDGEGTAMEVPKDPPEPGLIDNLEFRRDRELPEWEGRQGYWFSYVDEHPESDLQPLTEVPDFDPKTLYYEGGANDTETAVLFQGRTGKTETAAEDVEVYGGGIGVHVQAGDPYDAAARGYTGVSFWMRKIPTSSLSEVNVMFPQTKTWTDCSVCLDHLGSNVAITTTWKKYTVPFTGTAQKGFGDPVTAVDASQLIGVVWGVPSGKTVELLIDEVSFSSE